MIVYLDLVIIETILVNSLIFIVIETLYKERPIIIRIILANILSISFFLLCLSKINVPPISRLLSGIVIGIIGFRWSSILNMIVKLCIYYLLNMSFISSLIILRINNIFILIISLFIVVIMYIISTYKDSSNTFVRIDNKHYYSLYDSGNSSYYKDTPIVFLHSKYKSSKYKYVDKIFIECLAGVKEIDIYEGPKFTYHNQDIKVYYSFFMINGYDLILHKDIGGY